MRLNVSWIELRKFTPAILVNIAILIFICFFSSQELYKDETFFYPIANKFALLDFSFFWQEIKTYSVPIAPLSFILSGTMLKMHNSIYTLRIANLLYFFVLSLIITSLVFSFKINQSYKKYLVLILLFFNPYIFLVVPYYYTDSLYLLLVCIFLYFSLKKNNMTTWWALFLLPLSRQMGLLYIAGKCLAELTRSFKKTIAWGLAAIGICVLIVYWKGISPSVEFNIKNETVKKQVGSLRLDYIVFYFSAICFYLFPLILLRIKKVYKNKLFWTGAILGLILFYFFTPTRNHYHGVETLGIYHSFLLKIFSKELALIVMAFLSSCFSGYLLTLLFDKNVLLELRLFLIFFFVFHLNNQVGWEKYALEALILTSLCFLAQEEVT